MDLNIPLADPAATSYGHEACVQWRRRRNSASDAAVVRGRM